MRVRSFRAVLTDVECEFSYRVSLMEALEPVKADSDYVVAVIEESEMSDDQFFAGLSLALQVPSSGRQTNRIELIIFPCISHSYLLYHSIVIHSVSYIEFIELSSDIVIGSFVPIVSGFWR